MQDKGHHFSLAVAWTGFFVKLLLTNFNTVLTVACGLAALTASIYAILVNRKKLKLLDSRDPSVLKTVLKVDTE